MSCHSVRKFYVLQWHPLQIGKSISRPPILTVRRFQSSLTTQPTA